MFCSSRPRQCSPRWFCCASRSRTARTFRRRGVGRLAVELILNRFAGRWEITEYLRNPVAVSFWRRVVASYTQGRYQERVTNGEVRQVFDSGATRAATSTK